MAENVIDALVVTLGLRNEGFSQGMQAATQSLTGFATKVAGLAIGFETLQAGIHYFEDLHQRLADLYFTSRNLGVMGTELSRLGELAQMFGGRVEDATGSVQGLQAAVFNLRFKGQMSESLAMLQRFGVAYLNGNGTMRDPEAIARDAAVAIDRQARVANLTPGDRYQLAMSFGLQGGLASAAAQGSSGFDHELARARQDQRGLTEGTLRGQGEFERNIISRRTQRDIESSKVLDSLLPALEDVNELLAEIARKAIPTLADAIRKTTGFLEHPPGWVTETAKKVESTLNRVFPAAKPGQAPVIPLSPANFATEFGSRAGEQLGEALAGKLETVFDHWTQDLKNLFGTSGALQSIPGISQPIAPPALQFGTAPVTPGASRPSASDNAGAPPPTSMNGGPRPNITFENVTINSNGRDGTALARDFEKRIRRGYFVSNSDPGMVS